MDILIFVIIACMFLMYLMKEKELEEDGYDGNGDDEATYTLLGEEGFGMGPGLFYSGRHTSELFGN